MGSPVSVVIAEIVMQIFEEECFQETNIHSLFWHKFVDDTIRALPED